MANGTLNFSVIFSAVTQAFNTGVKGAAQNYQQATSSITDNSEEMGRATQALQSKLTDVFKAGDARDIVTAFKAATQELNNTKQGATLTASAMQSIGQAGKAATQQLTAELKAAQAELRTLQQAKVTPADLDAAKTKVSSLTSELSKASTELKNLEKTKAPLETIVAAESKVESLREELAKAGEEYKKAQQSAAASMQKSAADIEAAKMKVTTLKTELAQSGVEYSRLQSAATAAMRRATADTEQLASASRNSGQAIYGMLNIKSSGQLRTEIAAINQQLTNFKANSSAPAAEVQRVTKAAEAQIAALRAQVEGTNPLFTTLANGIKAIGPAAATLTGVTVGLAAVKEGVEAVLAATMRYEAAMKQLEFATGSITKAKQEYEFLLDVTKRLGLDLQASTEGFAKMAAATKGTILEGEKTRQVFEGVAAAAATMNMTGADTNGMFLALAQMMGKGKVTAEEWRGQFAERMPAAAAVMQKALGMTTVEFNAFIESGADAAMFLEKLGPAFINAFGPTAQQNAKSLQGQVNGLKTEFEQLLIKIGQGGVGQAAVAILGDLRGAVESVSGAIDRLDPATVAAVKEMFRQLYDMVGNTFMTLMSGVGGAASALNDLLNGVVGVVTGFAGLDSSNEQVGLLTRSLQGITILMGVLNDGVKGVEIALSLAIGVAQSFFSAVALGLSMITFGDLSRELEQFAFTMQDKAQKSFQDASDKAMEFKSSAVAAADAAIAAHGKAGENIKAAHAGAADAAGKDQASIGEAGAQAAEETATAHVNAAGQVVAAQGQMGEAATQTSQTIQLAGVAGEKAIVSMAAANQAVIKSMMDLAKESGIALPVVKMTAEQLGQTMGEVAAKSDQAATAIGNNLKAAMDSLNARDFVVLWDSYTKGLEKAGASTELLNKTTLEFATGAVKVLGGDLTAALGKMSQGFSESVVVLDRLVDSMDNLKKQGVDTGVALEQALTGMLNKAKNPTEINELIKRWEELGKQGLVSGQQMSEGLEAARKKMDEVKPGINSVNEALRTLGQTANDTSANMQAKYAEAFRVLRESGTATFSQLTAGLKTMFEAANDTKSLQALTQQFKDLGAQGKLASYDVKQGLADIQNKMDEMKPGINSLAEAFKTFGMTTREEAAAMADRYGQAFTVMRQSGQATAAELRTAFTRYAEAAVQANGGVVDGFVQAQAAAQGLQVRVDETGKVIVEAMGAGAQATDAMGMSLERAIDSYGRLGAAAQAAAEAALAAKEKELEMTERLMDAKQKEIDLENRRRNVDKDGFTLGSDGNRMTQLVETWMSTMNQLKQWGLDDKQSRGIADKLYDDNGDLRGLNSYRKDSSDTFSSILRRMAEEELRKTPMNTTGPTGTSTTTGGDSKPTTGGTGTQSTSKAPSSGVSTGTGKTTTVVLKDGKSTVSAAVAPNDEKKFINMLQTSKGVS